MDDVTINKGEKESKGQKESGLPGQAHGQVLHGRGNLIFEQSASFCGSKLSSFHEVLMVT